MPVYPGAFWTSRSHIDLGNITVTDGVVYKYAITSGSNGWTQRCVWEYTGSGPYSGYEKRDLATHTLKYGTGYFIKVLSTSPNIILSIPPNNTLQHA